MDIWIYTMLKDNAAGEYVIVQGDGSYNWIKNESKAIELDSDSDSLYDGQQMKPEQII